MNKALVPSQINDNINRAKADYFRKIKDYRTYFTFSMRVDGIHP
ncbi:hypothetical protein [Sphingobacterium multivorum]